jgi:hypothetical protein
VIRDDRRAAFEAAPASGATGETGASGGAGGAGPAATPAAERELSDFGNVTDEQSGGGDASHGSVAGIDVGAAPRVIRTAELGLVIPRDSFDERFGDAVDAAEAHGGFVATSTTRERSGGVTIRVPAASFNEALRNLRELGDVEVQTVQGRDVTAQYVDVRARLRIAKARRAVLLELMTEATTIDQSIRVQNALDDTQLRIEELEGQRRFLDDRTSFATIQVHLREQGVRPEPDVTTPSVANAFERGVAGFVGVIAGIVVGLGYLIPVVLIALVGWLVVLRVRRRRTA